MKTIVINAGPKRKDHNAQLMKSAARGAESAGAEVEYVDLYKYDLRGCMVCLICKQEGKSCRCYWKDEISPLIERILESDCLLIGVPIFFSEPASHYKAFMERLIYCMVEYGVGNGFKGKVNIGLFYSINYSENYFEDKIHPILKHSEDLFKMFHGKIEINAVRHITKREYDLAGEDDDAIKQREKQFDENLKKAFEIGAELSK